ncbi:CapA family protein [bacterium]|nr:CapA family protein [bacterium]
MKIKNSPYNLKETFGYFKRNFLGPVTKNRGLVKYCPQFNQLNSGVHPQITIGFIGDIMDMAGRSLRIGDGVRQFVQTCDYLVGNFEATITTAKGAYMAQRHIPQILEALMDFFPPERTFLGLANNHSGDFGLDIWSDSKKQIEDKGFHVFGTSKTPYVEIKNRVRIIGATQWSNQPVNYITKIEDASSYCQPGLFNILYPHWGYELELFPRPEMVAAGKSWSDLFDAIIGHHSHIPQPITQISVKKPNGPAEQVIAYGLGDFCIHEKLKHYLYGQVLKLIVGPQATGDWKTGALEWRFINCQQKNEKVWETEVSTCFPYAIE